MKWGFFWRLVLIGTLWNVNFFDSVAHGLSDLGFNRYIVECKYDFYMATITIYVAF